MNFQRGDVVRGLRDHREELFGEAGAIVIHVPRDDDRTWRRGHVKVMCFDGLSRWVHRGGIELVHRSGMKDR